MRVSIHEFMAFMRCRRLYDYSSSNRQNLQPKRPSKNLWLGDGVHTALQGYYSRGNHPEVTFVTWARKEITRIQEAVVLTSEDQNDLEAAFELGRDMLNHYLSYAQAHDDFEPISVQGEPSVEQEFAVAIPGTKGEGLFVGRCDGLIKDQAGYYWVIDHKTTANWPDSFALQMDQQFTAYVWAIQKLANAGIIPNIPRGATIQGVLYNGLRKKSPTVPRLLKNGTLSQASNQDTTAEVYREAIKENGLSLSDYSYMLDQLEAKGNTFFRREYVIKTPGELEQFEQYLCAMYRAVSDPNLEIFPTPTRECAWWCGFRSPCFVTSAGGDGKQVLRAEYIQRPPRGVVYVDSDEG